MKKNIRIISLVLLLLIGLFVGISNLAFASDDDDDDKYEEDHHNSYYFNVDDDDYKYDDHDSNQLKETSQVKLEKMNVEYRINDLTKVKVESDFEIDQNILDNIDLFATYISEKYGELVVVELKFKLENSEIVNEVSLIGNLTSDQENLLESIKSDIISAINDSGLNKAEVELKIEHEVDNSVGNNSSNEMLINNSVNVSSHNLIKMKDQVLKIEEQLNSLDNVSSNSTNSSSNNISNTGNIVVSVDRSFVDLLIDIFKNLFG